jgi:SP family sugar:H+ symporter-like MFS transporter
MISSSAFFYIIGVAIEVTSTYHWVPMYQSESVPKSIRGVAVSSYQLMITLGIWTANMVCPITSQFRNVCSHIIGQLEH